MNHNSAEAYHQLAFYTLAHPGKEFIHQHIVDAYTAQQANEHTKPIALFFALAGLYLFIEKRYAGKAVQRAHLQFCRRTKSYPSLAIPKEKGSMSIEEVLLTKPGTERDEKIKDWCRSVWETYREEHQKVIAYTELLLQA